MRPAPPRSPPAPADPLQARPRLRPLSIPPKGKAGSGGFAQRICFPGSRSVISAGFRVSAAPSRLRGGSLPHSFPLKLHEAGRSLRVKPLSAPSFSGCHVHAGSAVRVPW